MKQHEFFGGSKPEKVPGGWNFIIFYEPYQTRSERKWCKENLKLGDQFSALFVRQEYLICQDYVPIQQEVNGSYTQEYQQAQFNNGLERPNNAQ